MMLCDADPPAFARSRQLAHRTIGGCGRPSNHSEHAHKYPGPGSITPSTSGVNARLDVAGRDEGGAGALPSSESKSESDGDPRREKDGQLILMVLTALSIVADVSVPGPLMSLAKLVVEVRPVPLTAPKHDVSVPVAPT